MLYSNTRTTPRSEHNWLVSAATDVWSIPPTSSFPHSAPTLVNPRCDDVTNLTVDGVKRFTPAVRHIHVKKHIWSTGINGHNNKRHVAICKLKTRINMNPTQRYYEQESDHTIMTHKTNNAFGHVAQDHLWYNKNLIYATISNNGSSWKLTTRRTDYVNTNVLGAYAHRKQRGVGGGGVGGDN